MRKLIAIALSVLSTPAFSQHYSLLVGTYTMTGSRGLYTYEFDAKTGEAKLLNTLFVENPSYLVLNKNADHIYTVNESGPNKGGVSSFSFNKNTGAMHLINQVPSHGDAPCYIAIDASNKWLAVANYAGGSLAVFPVESDGSVGEAVQVIQHTGNSVNKDRQEAAHVHSTVFSPDNHFLAVADLGTDKVSLYPFDAKKEKPLSDMPIEINATPGSGPRHILFNPTRPFAYLIDELAGNITTYRYKSGKLDRIQTISSHPAGFTGDKGSAAIHFSPDGKFLYASNRGESNTISIFSINSSNGMLVNKGFQSTGGDHPRDFNIDPSGNYLLAGNTKSDDITIFKRDRKTGLLKDSGRKINIPQPTVIVFTKQ